MAETNTVCVCKSVTTPARLKKQSAVALTSIIIFACFCICLWICQVIETDKLSEKLTSLQHDFDCAMCITDDYDGKLCKKCTTTFGLKALHDGAFPSRCLEQQSNRKKLQKMVRDQNGLLEAKLRNQMKENEKNFLDSALTAMYQSPRIIVHWFPIGMQHDDNNTGVIGDYERHRSTYTVSPGPRGSYDDGRLVVMSGGLHYVYAKLTFECMEADRRDKHIGLEVIKEDPVRNTSVILSERVKARCNLKGDLETLFQRGIFHLPKDSKLKLRYKASENVRISSTRDQAYKSCLGMYEVSSLTPH